VCKRHGAKVKVKLCSSEGCTNIVVKGGVCIRHGANHCNPYDESTAFGFSHGSAYDETTAAFSNRYASQLQLQLQVVKIIHVAILLR